MAVTTRERPGSRYGAVPMADIGELDRHLFGEGRHLRLWDVLGSHPDDDGATFAVWAPNANRVTVVGDFNNWDDGVHPLTPQGSTGIWAGRVRSARVGHRYKYAVDGADRVRRWKADPVAQASEVPPANASVITRSEFVWSDDAWLSSRGSISHAERPMRVYEVHLGSWRPGLSTQQLAAELADYVTSLGFTHVELLPVMEHPYAPSWGYQVTGYFAPSARFGVPDDVRRLVDTLHDRGIGVILDWVPAHFPADDWALARFDGTALYEHLDPRQGRHPDWGTLVFNYGRNEVRNFLLASALYWVREFHADGLRVDAVASMLYLDYSRSAGEWIPNQYGGRENLEAISFIQDVNATMAIEHPDVMMIAEESTAWPGVTHPTTSGGLGFSHKWNMGWMHDTLGYFQRDPIHRRFHHRDLTFGLLYAHTERFTLPLSHDEVVHGKGSMLAKMAGDTWQQFANLRALYGWMWAYPGSPLIFMGSELGVPQEWSESGGIDWSLADQTAHRGVASLVAALNEGSRLLPALWLRDADPGGFQWLDADDAEHSVFAFLRWGANANDVVAVAANFTPIPRQAYRLGVPSVGRWRVALDTDASQFDGSGLLGDDVLDAAGEPWQGQPASLLVTLPPLAVCWLVPA
jgi:1,4-alpha-glucan branching enzyme